MKKILSTIIIFVTVALTTSCSNISFNDRYINASWNKIIIAPFDGNNADIAEEEFEHALAVSSQINIVPASLVLLKLKETSLIEKYKAAPTKTIIELARIMKADGVIFAKVESYSPESRRHSELTSTSASIYARLIDVNDMSVVLTSQQQSSSIFSNSSSVIKDVSLNAIDEFQEGFIQLNGSE